MKFKCPKYEDCSIANTQIKEIEILKTKDLLPLFLVSAQYLFQKLSLQAQKEIDTYETERLLLVIKEILKRIQQYEYCFWSRGFSFHLWRETPLEILRKLKEEKRYLIVIVNEQEIFIPCVRIEIINKFIYFFNLLEHFEVPPLPALKWTGKELVAIHTENIPKSLIDKGILQIEQQEVKWSKK